MTTVERLKRLQRQAGTLVAAPAAATVPTTPPASRMLDDDTAAELESRRIVDHPLNRPLCNPLHGDNATVQPRSAAVDQLRRLLRIRLPTAAPVVPTRQRELLGTELFPGLRLIERRYPADELSAILPPRWHSADAVPRTHFLCFDTETTGLSGGSGTRAFMIGAADWHEQTLRIRQLYITTMAAEIQMLTTFAGWLHPATVFVSYNGRSYDAPLLATRYRLQRMANPFLEKPHVDLLHPVRRRYRGIWENCKLATIERHVLQVLREDDLPGAQAPAAWLAYLRYGASTNLMRVLEHNRQDVQSLARLLEHMAVPIEACTQVD